ncbi:MAG: hypothetical protein R2706_08090 [Acidimicrobiales bacterium]
MTLLPPRIMVWVPIVAPMNWPDIIVAVAAQMILPPTMKIASCEVARQV